VSCKSGGRGEKRSGQLGFVPSYQVRNSARSWDALSKCEVDEGREICIDSPGVLEGSYLYPRAIRTSICSTIAIFLRQVMLGPDLIADGYLWINRACQRPDLRWGFTIDPPEIGGGVGRSRRRFRLSARLANPMAVAGELPCAYVRTWFDGRVKVTNRRLNGVLPKSMSTSAPRARNISRCWASCRKTAVGKVFKPDLRKRAKSRRVYNAARFWRRIWLRRSFRVVEDKKLVWWLRLTRPGVVRRGLWRRCWVNYTRAVALDDLNAASGLSLSWLCRMPPAGVFFLEPEGSLWRAV